MTDKYHLISYYFETVGLVTQAILITLQLKTYRATGHRSLLFMAAASAVGVLHILAVVAPTALGCSLEAHWSWYLLAAVLIAIQCVVGIGSVAFMFRAFELAVSQGRVTEMAPRR